MKKTILSIRGGGIRGIIPCCMLVELEKQLGGLTREHIDFCAGTSTGALLTAAIAVGIQASELLRVYTDRSQEIFTPQGIIGAARKAIVGYPYSSKNIAKVLSSLFGKSAYHVMNDSPIPIMITAVDMSGHEWYFVRDSPLNSFKTGFVPIIDAATASASAPTYFGPWQLEISGKLLRFFDGGAGGVANPAHQACIEAFRYGTFTPGTTRLVDLGTGWFPSDGNAAPKGLLSTVSWVVSTLLDRSEDTVTSTVDELWPGLRATFNPKLTKAIDMADTEAIPELVSLGTSMAMTMDWKTILNS